MPDDAALVDAPIDEDAEPVAERDDVDAMLAVVPVEAVLAAFIEDVLADIALVVLAGTAELAVVADSVVLVEELAPAAAGRRCVMISTMVLPVSPEVVPVAAMVAELLTVADPEARPAPVLDTGGLTWMKAVTMPLGAFTRKLPAKKLVAIAAVPEAEADEATVAEAVLLAVPVIDALADMLVVAAAPVGELKEPLQ